MSKLLLDEAPLQVQASLATAIGLNQAIALQQLHWVLQNPHMGQEVDGRKYVYMSLSDWRRGHFPFWSEATIQRTFANLERSELVLVRANLNRLSFDRTKWYAINQAAVARLEDAFEQNERIVEHRKVKNAHCRMKDASSQNEPTIPESSAETSSERGGATYAPPPLRANPSDEPVAAEASATSSPPSSAQNSGWQSEMVAGEMSERAFVRRFAPLIARVLGRDEPVNEDKAVARAIHRYHTDADWLEGRLYALAESEGDSIREKKGNAYWIRDQLQKEWVAFKQERDHVTRRTTEAARYERECRAAIAAAQAGDHAVQGNPARPLHLHAAIRNAAADSRAAAGDRPDGALVAVRELHVRRDRMDL